MYSSTIVGAFRIQLIDLVLRYKYSSQFFTVHTVVQYGVGRQQQASSDSECSMDEGLEQKQMTQKLGSKHSDSGWFSLSLSLSLSSLPLPVNKQHNTVAAPPLQVRVVITKKYPE